MRNLGDAARVVRQHQLLAHVGREDHHLAVLLHQVAVHRHLQHHVGRAVAQVMAAPDHVAQVVVHVLARVERQQRQPQLELARQRGGDRHVQAVEVVGRAVGERRVVLVDRHFQRAIRADAFEVAQVGLRARQWHARGEQGRQHLAAVGVVVMGGGHARLPSQGSRRVSR
ncbi:hypothetical protein ACFJGX_21565 [Hydrogenophaga sp. UC242_50]|uniref:hypothetical protein n=1 Tax=Hydrogenophaga sp. UC242_50 TaxID=3350169 RepID=UPI0036D2A6FC